MTRSLRAFPTRLRLRFLSSFPPDLEYSLRSTFEWYRDLRPVVSCLQRPECPVRSKRRPTPPCAYLLRPSALFPADWGNGSGNSFPHTQWTDLDRRSFAS